MKKALVAGALGVTGRAVVNHLITLSGWEVIGLSRRSPEFRTTAQFIPVDLLNRSEVETRLSGIGDVTHVFYAALQPAPDFFAEVAPNLDMLVHTVETVERFSKTFPGRWCCSKAQSFMVHISVRTRRRQKRPIRDTCRRISITIKRTT
jgi:NAD(P)-dependent dehydrogenase (short-subunit alcohol dehydrogenase family)